MAHTNLFNRRSPHHQADLKSRQQKIAKDVTNFYLKHDSKNSLDANADFAARGFGSAT
jgi:hypothetical protein